MPSRTRTPSPILPRTSRRARLASTALVLALALLAAACGGDGGGGGTSVALVDADGAFLRGMVPHHAEAVDMARLVPERSDRPELLALADDIVASQEAEIEQMQQLLADAGADPADEVAGDAGQGDHDMEGMMGEDAMARLADLDGEAFDLAFLDLMTVHHEGAIEAAQRVIDRGEDPAVRALAEDIITEQEAEIAQMSTWRQEWAAAG